MPPCSAHWHARVPPTAALCTLALMLRDENISASALYDGPNEPQESPKTSTLGAAACAAAAALTSTTNFICA